MWILSSSSMPSRGSTEYLQSTTKYASTRSPHLPLFTFFSFLFSPCSHSILLYTPLCFFFSIHFTLQPPPSTHRSIHHHIHHAEYTLSKHVSTNYQYIHPLSLLLDILCHLILVYLHAVTHHTCISVTCLRFPLLSFFSPTPFCSHLSLPLSFDLFSTC